MLQVEKLAQLNKALFVGPSDRSYGMAPKPEPLNLSLMPMRAPLGTLQVGVYVCLSRSRSQGQV